MYIVLCSLSGQYFLELIFLESCKFQCNTYVSETALILQIEILKVSYLGGGFNDFFVCQFQLGEMIQFHLRIMLIYDNLCVSTGFKTITLLSLVQKSQTATYLGCYINPVNHGGLINYQTSTRLQVNGRISQPNMSI